jgi:hypothetical protein
LAALQHLALSLPAQLASADHHLDCKTNLQHKNNHTAPISTKAPDTCSKQHPVPAQQATTV